METSDVTAVEEKGGTFAEKSRDAKSSPRAGAVDKLGAGVPSESNVKVPEPETAH